MPAEHTKYVPALSLRWLTPFYDALVEKPMAAIRMRSALLDEMGDPSGRRILDVGCGSGSFVILLKRAYPAADLTGLDGDPQILEIARSKAGRLGMDIRFSEALSYSMPYPDDSFDVVTTTLMLHHLSREAKQRTANEMYRVLKPGGELFGIDFAEPRGRLGRSMRPFTRRFEHVAENLDGFLPVMFQAAGFGDYREIRRFIMGSVAVFRARSPSGQGQVLGASCSSGEPKFRNHLSGPS